MPDVPVYIRARSQLPVFARGGIQQYLKVDIGNAFQSLSGSTEQHLHIYVKVHVRQSLRDCSKIGLC